MRGQRALWSGPSWNCPSPISVLCPSLYRTEHCSKGRKGRKGAEKRGGTGMASKGTKIKRGPLKTGQMLSYYGGFLISFFLIVLSPRQHHNNQNATIETKTRTSTLTCNNQNQEQPQQHKSRVSLTPNWKIYVLKHNNIVFSDKHA